MDHSKNEHVLRAKKKQSLWQAFEAPTEPEIKSMPLENLVPQKENLKESARIFVGNRAKLLSKINPLLKSLDVQTIALLKKGVLHESLVFVTLFVEKFWQEAANIGVVTEGTVELQAALCDLDSEELMGITRIIAFYFLYQVVTPEAIKEAVIRKNFEFIFKLPENAQDTLLGGFTQFEFGAVRALLSESIIKENHRTAFDTAFTLYFSPCFFRQVDLVFDFMRQVREKETREKINSAELLRMVREFQRPRTS